MSPFANYLEKLGSNFLVAAMIPSLALVVASILMFDPILHVSNAFQDAQGTYQLIGFGLIIFICTVIVGFTLTALNTFILKMFEGYVKIPLLDFFYRKNLRIHRQKAYRLADHRQRLKKRIILLEDLMDENPWLKGEVEDLKAKYYQSASEYSLQYPDDWNDILPTRFGNTLKAAENYPGERYGFDGVMLWPRLIEVVSKEYRLTLDNTRNELSFLVNMSLLSVTFSAFCILAIFITMWTTEVVSADWSVIQTFFVTVSKYLIAALLGLVSGRLFYNASIYSLGTYGLTVRSSFDLFRLELLKKLELIQPKNSKDEFNTWKNLNEFIVLGHHSVSYEQLDFRDNQTP
jgi:hypothetical protein